MHESIKKYVTMLALLALLQGASAHPPLPVPSSSVTYGDARTGQVLVLGCVTNNPKYNYGQMQGMSNYVLERVRDLGVEAVEVFTVDSHEKMSTLLKNGRVDWVTATPYSALIYEEQANAELLLAKKIRGNADYRSIFFARSDSGVNSIDDLVGRVIAFEKPGSTSAYFLPAAEILARGYKLVELDGPLDKPPQGAIGYVFSGDEANSAIWTHKRIVAAAAFSDEDWNSHYNMPDAFREDIKIFHSTSKAPRSIEVVRGDLSERLKERVKTVLFAANHDPEAEDALRGYYQGSDFAELTTEQLDVLQRIRLTMGEFEKLVNPAVRANLPPGVD